jgi:hypothetical protein
MYMVISVENVVTIDSDTGTNHIELKNRHLRACL